MIPVPYMRSGPKTVGSSMSPVPCMGTGPETVISSMSQTPPEGEVYEVRKIEGQPLKLKLNRVKPQLFTQLIEEGSNEVTILESGSGSGRTKQEPQRCHGKILAL